MEMAMGAGGVRRGSVSSTATSALPTRKSTGISRSRRQFSAHPSNDDVTDTMMRSTSRTSARTRRPRMVSVNVVQRGVHHRVVRRFGKPLNTESALCKTQQAVSRHRPLRAGTCDCKRGRRRVRVGPALRLTRELAGINRTVNQPNMPRVAFALHALH